MTSLTPKVKIFNKLQFDENRAESNRPPQGLEVLGQPIIFPTRAVKQNYPFT
jgi:hypothetical protein